MDKNKLESEFLLYNRIKTVQECLKYGNFELAKEIIDDMEKEQNKKVCSLLKD